MLRRRLRPGLGREILVARILQVDALENDCLMLWLFSGETVRLRIKRARQWKEAIEQQQSRKSYVKTYTTP